MKEKNNTPKKMGPKVIKELKGDEIKRPPSKLIIDSSKKDFEVDSDLDIDFNKVIDS